MCLCCRFEVALSRGGGGTCFGVALQAMQCDGKLVAAAMVTNGVAGALDERYLGFEVRDMLRKVVRVGVLREVERCGGLVEFVVSGAMNRTLARKRWL